MANFRPLQPAPTDQEQPPPPPLPPIKPLTQKPKRTVTLGACVACRKRKSKCDGVRPICSCCSQKNTECVYELGPNEKPSQAMKRKNEEMQGELSNLRQLYDFLRLRPEPEALEILRRIRDNPQDTTPSQRIQDLADFVKHRDALIHASYQIPGRHQSESGHPLTLPPLRLALDSPRPSASNFSAGLPFPGPFPTGPDGPASQRRRLASDTDVSASSDSPSPLPPPSIEVILHPTWPAVMDCSLDPRLRATGNWTKVTNDTHFLVLLMSAWHTWEYRFYHFLDWDLFLDDLSTGRTDFCSELLVNAVLATASFQSPLIEDRSKPFSDNIQTQFYQEARRLWEFGEGQDSLPRLSSALCLFMVLGKHGRDKVGHAFLLEACRMAHSLGLFRLSQGSMQKPQHVPKEKWGRARAVTGWALFNFQLLMSFTYPFPTILKSQPPTGIPYDDTPDREALFRSECARNVIILECANTSLDPDDPTAIPPRPEEIEDLYLKLKSWWGTRPESLNPTKFPSPEHLLAAMQYHVSIIRLFQPFLHRDSVNEPVGLYRDRAHSITSSAIKELRRLLVLHETQHGWVNAIPYVLHPIMVTSFGSLEEVAFEGDSRLSPEANEPYQGLLTCLRALRTLSGYVFYAQPLFRLLTQTCQTLQIPLPMEVITTLNYYQSEEWTKNAASVVRSRYVADMRKPAADVESATMDAIISGWDALTVTHEGSGSGKNKSDLGSA